MSDPNMKTLYQWAFNYPSADSTLPELEIRMVRLIELVDMVNTCIGKEFEKDKQEFRIATGRDPSNKELQGIHLPFYSYDQPRKLSFLKCIERCLERFIEIDTKFRLNLSFRLWAGCLDAAKTLAPSTQSGPNTSNMRSAAFTEMIDVLASKDPIYKKGVEVASMWRPESDISFDGVPKTSPSRKYEKDAIARKGIRQVKFCEVPS